MNLFIFAWTAVALAVYFAPTFIAWNKLQGPGVFAVNFLLGWSIVGWAIAMVWALSPDHAQVDRGIDYGRHTAVR
jgi:hypothetical protein